MRKLAQIPSLFVVLLRMMPRAQQSNGAAEPPSREYFYAMERGLPILLAVILTFSLTAVAAADIVEWKDDAGVTHYTNLKGEVPSQEVARVVVDEQIWIPKGSEVPDAADAKPEPVAQPDPPRAPGDEVSRAYIAGLDS